MKYNEEHKDYGIIATGDGMKLERWGEYILLRPDPQIIWPSRINMNRQVGLSAYYTRSADGGGKWNYNTKMPEDFVINWRNLKFSLKLMGFKHTGLFPEQAVNWAKMMDLIRGARRPIKVLNLFAYTGGATVACASVGATVCHVDSAKSMVERAKVNAKLSKVPESNIRYIIDDCSKFVAREYKRGNKYEAILMDPPSFGRGPNGEKWKIEDKIYELVAECSKILSKKPLFFLINSYTTGLQPQVLKNILQLALGDKGVNIEAYEVGLPTDEDIILPAGASAMATFGEGKNR